MSILVEIFVLIPLRRITKIILRRLVLRGKGFSSLCVSLQSRKMHLIAQGNKNLESLIMIFILPLEMLKWQLHSVHHWFNLSVQDILPRYVCLQNKSILKGCICSFMKILYFKKKTNSNDLKHYTIFYSFFSPYKLFATLWICLLPSALPLHY